jgi:5,6-dimethylbenzimidazole synthase
VISEWPFIHLLRDCVAKVPKCRATNFPLKDETSGDRSRTGPVVLGRTHQADMDLYSAVCAVQNLWLAARVENIGVGWVSIIRHDDLREALGIPPSIQPIAYLCVGYVTHFFRKPELETAGWLPRMPLSDVVWFDRWHAHDKSDSLLECL